MVAGPALEGALAVLGADERTESSGGKLELEGNSSRPSGSLQEAAPFEAELASPRAPIWEKQIGGSGVSLEPPGPLLELPGPLLTVPSYPLEPPG